MGRQIVDQKILDIASETTKNLDGNKNLNEEIKSKIKAIIVEERVETNTEETNGLAEIISKNLGIENNSETKIEAKKIRLEIEKWKKENTKDVVDFKKEEFKSRFEEETRKINPDLDEKQLKTVKDYGELIAENYIGDNSLENQKNEALEINSKSFGPGRLENAWSDLEGTVTFLKKSPGEVQNIKSKHNSLKNELTGINLPNNLRQTRSFENIVSNFNGNSDHLFSRTQKYLGWADNVNRLTGGWLNKTVTDAGVKMAGKIGNQAMQDFATNSLNVLAKEGFQKGFQSVLTGILNGGVSATATATAGGAAAGGVTVAAGAAVSATGVGAIVVAAMAVLKVVKDVGNKIAEKLGINTKKFFEENFGKIGGGILNGIVSIVALPTILLGAVSAVAVGPILIAVFGGLFVYQMFQGSLVSSLVPPKGQGSGDLISNIDPNAVIPEGCPSGWPTSGNITRIPNDIFFTKQGRTSNHREAIDIANRPNTEIYSVTDGWATPGYDSVCGISLEITSKCEENGVLKKYSVLYCHLIRTPMGGKSQSVKKGQLVANMGNSGDSTGFHLHYKIIGLSSISRYLPYPVNYHTKVITDYGK